MVGVQQNLNGSRDLTTSLSGMVCDPWASTCYDQPIYQILSLYLYPKYESDTKCRKCGGLVYLGVTRSQWKQRHLIEYIRVPISLP